MINTWGIICTPIARRNSLLGSRRISYSHSSLSTNGFTLLMFWAWSMLMAITFTPVSSCHSAYCSWMAFSSRLQGLHHVAKKLMINGLPLLLSLDVSTVLPSRVFNITEGNCADIVVHTMISIKANKNLNSFIFIYVFAAKLHNFY